MLIAGGGDREVLGDDLDIVDAFGKGHRAKRFVGSVRQQVDIKKRGGGSPAIAIHGQEVGDLIQDADRAVLPGGGEGD